jgi:hypothetical protein
MHDPVMAAVVLAELVDLGMAVVAGRDAIVGLGVLDLLVFEPAVLEPGVLVPGLQKTAAAPAAVVVGAVGHHVDKVLLSHDRLDHEAQVLCDRIAEAFPDDLAGILDRELDLQILVPIGVDLQLSFPDPFGVVFIDALDLNGMLDVELFQSFQD